jgi:hypothetical protein
MEQQDPPDFIDGFRVLVRAVIRWDDQLGNSSLDV